MDNFLKARAFDQLQQHLSAGFAILNSDLRYVMINDTLAQFNGKTVADHIGRTVADILPDLYPVIGPMLKSVLETGQSLLDFKIVDDATATNEGHDWLGSYIA